MNTTGKGVASHTRFRARSRWLVGALGVVCGCVAIWFLLLRESSSQLLEKGRLALDRRDFAGAQRHAEAILTRNPQSGQALLLAAVAATNQREFPQVLDYCGRVADDGSPTAVEARCIAGELLLVNLHDASAAREQFRRATAQEADGLLANRRLAYLEGLGNGGWSATPYRIALIRAGAVNSALLEALGTVADTWEHADTLERFRQTRPDDPIVLTALARLARRQGRPAEALSWLRRALQADAQWMGAHVELGSVLLEGELADEFVRWHAALPSNADEHPEIWAIQGRYAQMRNENPVAARCFAEALRRDPNHPLANYQLGHVLTALGHPQRATPFLDRANTLEQYLRALEGTTGLASPEMIKTAALAEELSLFWEAYGWCRLVLQQHGHTAEVLPAKEILARVAPRLREIPTSRAAAEAYLAAGLDLAAYPLPDWPLEPLRVAAAPVDGPGGRRVTFEDRSGAAGLEFTYFNGGNPREDGMKEMYEFTGGGVAVLDFDGDGWPDLYLTQGTFWPVERDRSSGPVDRLFRNLGDGRFEEVTRSAELAESGFGQGVTVGDFNNDGFADLYVGNIGGNRLYQNNGDGTFTDVTQRADVAGQHWTTSCLIADLNGDTWPDIYVVNYLAGDDLFTRICGNQAGRTLCLPHYFPGAQDQLYLSRGDGTFENVTQEAGIVKTDGRGMGIVAADFAGRGALDLFVANDLAANFFFVNQAGGSSGRPLFADQARLNGLAANRDGRYEACMGVAIGDSDGSGRLDLFVTNFFQESNTLYLQQPGGFFEDATHRAGLATPSLSLLGFGTQFLDADLDGDLDLIVTNGHVDDARSIGHPYQMPPQFFENVGEGRFRLGDAAALGPYFQGNYLGRGMARLDWNRDGKEDVVISHLDAPAALLTNTTEDPGRFLALKLVAVRTARDAIGATATVTAGGRTWIRQLTAGDGYQASNQRLLTFGLGDAQRVDKLAIQWPSGVTQEFTDLPVDVELLAVEERTLTILHSVP
jgi:tetratricopeptide (TPR) repeat protein